VFHEPRRAAPVAAVAVMAAALVSAASAAALGPTGADTVAAPVTTAPSTASAAASGMSLFVVSDSVVATATLHYSGPPPDVVVAWGDGAHTRTSPPIASVPGRPMPTAGTVVFQHVYAPSANGAGFIKHVSVVSPVSGQELVGRDVAIVPRYRVTQYAVEFSPLNHCDSVAEAYTEWRVFRDGGGLPYKAWNFDRHTADLGGVGLPLPDFQPLPDSAVSVETTAGSAPRVAYGAWEEDPFQNEYFDRQFINFNPLLGSRTVTLTYHEVFGHDCRIQVRTPIDVHLLTPGFAGGPVASQ
jgi:hypothetical protein